MSGQPTQKSRAHGCMASKLRRIKYPIFCQKVTLPPAILAAITSHQSNVRKYFSHHLVANEISFHVICHMASFGKIIN